MFNTNVLNKKAKTFEEFLSTIGTELLTHRVQRDAIAYSFMRKQDKNRNLREGIANRASFELPVDPLLDPVDEESMATLLHRQTSMKKELSATPYTIVVRA